MSKVPQPFEYRGAWRAQVTCKNGSRPHKDFADHASAKQWIVDTLALNNSEHQPEPGGPTQATLAQALNHYASLHTVNKGGVASELNRINHYLAADGMSLLRAAKNANDQVVLETYTPKKQPQGWQEHNDARRAERSGTYAAIAALARKRCSIVNTADMRRLMTTMKAEGLSDSTIQKEIALLRHLFNVAAKEWNWKGFENPTAGLKLGKSQARFVFITKAQEAALWSAIAECDNPYFWPLVVCALETTMRRGSLLAMRWDQTDLEGRMAHVPSKTGAVNVPLSLHIVSVLSDMPHHESGKVFPMSGNAVEMVWDGVRKKAGLPTLQFKDIRHLGATAYARRGFNAHQLKAVLGHKTLYMAQVYVNLVAQDVLDVMDATAPTVPVIQVPPIATDSGANILKERRSARMANAVRKQQAANASKTAPVSTAVRVSAEAMDEAPHTAHQPAPEFAASAASVDDATALFVKSGGIDTASAVQPVGPIPPCDDGPAQNGSSSVGLEANHPPLREVGNVIAFRPRQRAA